MHKANIVLGLGYGDEGKGLTTDDLCSISLSLNKKPIVVRFSGGQQAGHTVMNNGKKHSHSNFGAGTLRGLPSYFSEHTTFYPATIIRELEVLKEKGINPKLTLHPLSKMTTPFDVFDNRTDKENLGHGTCGLGVGKTMSRDLYTPYKLYAVDLLNPKMLDSKLDSLKEYYVNIDINNKDFKEEMQDFKEGISEIKWNIQGYNYLKEFDNLIFEGSQGIMLDMDHGIFPHVTFANTTSKNAIEILNKLKISDIETFYVTRAYSTRHGAGPFTESELNLINTEEETNVTNEYQKDLKFGHLNKEDLNYALSVDEIYNPNSHKSLVVTCLDQVKEENFNYDVFDKKFYRKFESRSPVTNLEQK